MKISKYRLKTTLLFVFIVTLKAYNVNSQSIDLSHKQALKILLEAKNEAEKTNVLVNIAIVDAGANLKAFIRMDESYLGSIDVAIKKAKTARYFNIDTGKLGELTQPGGIIYTLSILMED